MTLVQVNYVELGEPQPKVLVQSVNCSYDPKEIRCTLVGTKHMVMQVVSCNPTYEESHSSFYEGYYGDYNFSHLSVKRYSFRRTIS